MGLNFIFDTIFGELQKNINQYLVEKMFKSLIDGFMNMSSLEIIDIVMQEHIFESIFQIMNKLFIPIGSAMLAIFILINVLEILQKNDSIQGLSAIELPMKAFISGAISILIYNNLPYLFVGIQRLFDEFFIKIREYTSFSINSDQMLQNIINNSSKYGVSDMFLLAILVGIAWIIVWIIKLIIQVTIFGRIMELFILLALSPIPMCTIPSQEQRGLATNFIKYFISVCLQSSVIAFDLFLWGLIVSNVSYTMGAFQFIFIIIVLSIVLGVIVFTSGRISKSIMNVIS